MKTTVLTFFFLLFYIIGCYSQQQGNLLKKTNRYFNNQITNEPDSEYHGNWGGIEVGFNNYLTSSNKINHHFLELLPWHSRSVSINFTEFNINLYKKRMGITTGTALEINNYVFKKNFSLSLDTLAHFSYQLDTVHHFIKNKLSVLYLSVPILFEFQFPVGKKDKRIFFSIGGIGGLTIDAYTHQKYTENDVEHKISIRNSYHLLSYRYGLTFRMGYRFIRVFVNYSLSPLFKSEDAPELYPFSAGIALLIL